MCRAALPLLWVLGMLACERPVSPRTAASPPPAAVEALAAPAVPPTPPDRAEQEATPLPAPRSHRSRAGAGKAGRFWPGQMEQDTGLGGTCRADEECTAVPVGCCGCRAGGAQRAVPRSAVPAEAACQDAMCPMVISRHPSCQKVPRCVQGRCELVAPPAGSPAQLPEDVR